VYKKSNAPFGDMNIGLLQLQKSHIVLYGYVQNNYPQHQKRKKCQQGQKK
jgi:hypothetical protein